MSDAQAEEKKSLLGKIGGYIKEKVNDFMSGPKWGQTHAGGMARQGLAELRGAFYPESNIAQPTDYGVFGRATPGETADLRRDEAPSLDSNQEKTVEPSQRISAPELNAGNGVAEPKQAEQDVTSWGRSKLEQCNKELSSRESMEPERDEIEMER